MSAIKTIAAICLLACICAGCSGNQNNKMNRPQIIEQNKAYSPDKVSFADDMGVVFSDIRTSDEGQFFKLMFEVMNSKAGATTTPVYQIEWLGTNGYPMSKTPWKPLLIKGNQKVKVVEMATVPGVSDYKITISRKGE